MNIVFEKYHGTGNDFVMIDNRDGKYDGITAPQIKFLCDRHFGIGADGLILLQNRQGFDFWMHYFNADGNPSSMCGNGSRCTVAFAKAKGIEKTTYHFVASDGPHEALFDREGKIRVKLADVNQITETGSAKILNTGSPHYVKEVESIDAFEVKKEGEKIRYSETFAAEGINVNFVEKQSATEIKVRTYERGVEDETLSCGTGVTAASLVNAYQEGENNITVHTSGGKLELTFIKNGNHFSGIWLIGPALKVYGGEIRI